MRKTLGAQQRDAAYRAVAGGAGDEFEWASKAPATWLQYRSALHLYEAWCTVHNAAAFPATVDQSGPRVQGQDHGSQPALADDFTYLKYRLGVVLSLHHPRRLLALHHRLEAVHHHAGR